MKKGILVIFFTFFLFLPRISFAYSENEEMCYSQCAAYKFVWQGDYCYDTFQELCATGEGGTIKDTIKFLKSIYGVLKSGKNVDTVFKAWFMCKPLIEQCIAPQLRECRTTCTEDTLYYAPDLSVGHPYGNFEYHGVIFNEQNNTLTFKVVNNGRGYAWDIGVSASWGDTRNRDGMVSGGGQLFSETIPELIYAGARNGPPKTAGDYVLDFLIEETNFSQYLQGFKSDADNYDVPAIWYKTIPFTPQEGKLTKVIVNVDPNQMIKERSETNNTFVLTIDKLPTPSDFRIKSFSHTLEQNTLNNFLIDFQIENTGEESGEVSVKLFEKNNAIFNTQPLYTNTQTIQGLNTVQFNTFLQPDITAERAYCGGSKQYKLVVYKNESVVDSREFALPLYSGTVYGRVEDLFGKPVVGATIQASSGASTTSGKTGSYTLKHINQLGNVTLTFSHPDYSQTETKSLTFSMSDGMDVCDEGNLLFTRVNAVLKDQEVRFTVTIKNQSGDLVNAHVLAVNSSFRKEADINGTGPMPGLQPGGYLFTISAPGYKTIRQDVSAVPEQNNLEFILERLPGRPDDTGLHVIAPRLLWEKTLGSGERIIGNITGSKNGALLVASVGDNKSKTRKLFFLDFISGNQINEVSVPYSVEQQRYIGLDSSYDGGTVGLFVKPGKSSEKLDGIVKVFDRNGNEFGTTTLDHKLAVSMDVSPDGFYVCPFLLLDKGMHKYTDFETRGVGDDDFERNPASCPDYFLRNNNRITFCTSGLCEKTISQEEVRTIGEVDEHVATNKFDSTFNDGTILVRTHKKLYHFGSTNWNKELDSDNSFKSAAISPGGMYSIVTVGSGGSLKLNVFDEQGEDQTPEFPYKHVRFVFANDKGLFFASIVLNTIELYQIGEYDSEYRPPDVTPTVVPQWFDGLSYYSRGQFFPSNENTFASLDPGVIYRADNNIKMTMIRPYTSTNLGTLFITKDTIFSIDYNHNPILIKGQLTADFGSPVTIYAIKFDRYWTGQFVTKLNDFMHHLLPEDEYFIIQNVHTKYIVTNEPNAVNVAVESGEVKVTGEEVDVSITGGRQIRIDKNNKITESAYINYRTLAIITLLIISLLGAILFRFRNTKWGKGTLNWLRKIGARILKRK